MSTEIQEPIPLPLATAHEEKKRVTSSPKPLRRSIARTMLGPTVNRDWKTVSALTLISLALHLLVLGAIGLVVLNSPQMIEDLFTTVMEHQEYPDPIVEHTLFPDDHKIETRPDDALPTSTSTELEDSQEGPLNLNFGAGPIQVSTVTSGLPAAVEIHVGNETSGRMSIKAKKDMIEKFGGNSQTEAAVIAGLKWLARHQNRDGSWDFQHSNHPDCHGQCSQDGSLSNCRTGATGMALLTFLGAGHTHQAGDYQSELKLAVDFLNKAGKQSKKVFDLRGNPIGREGMYAHGICTIALCECAAMTRDPEVRKMATGACNFIVNAQSKTTGGWRYRIGDPGDTSVVGWQIMALKSGQNAKLAFEKKLVFKGAEKYLDWAQRNRGANYVYDPGRVGRVGPDDDNRSMTAVGLLSRMYLGWDRNTPALGVGVKYLGERGPSMDDMYYNYYATQVLHHWGGEEWTRWNEVMRDHLIRTQHPVRSGHFGGSWDLADPHGDAGGRLYMTCLCVMTLEVYYRHLPLYDRDNLKITF